MNRYTIILISVILLLFSCSSLACDLVYEVRSDEAISELCVTIEKNADGISYRSTYRDVKQIYHYNSDNTLMRWEYVDSPTDTDFKASRNAGEILIRGTSSGKPVNKSLTAGDQVWLQNSEFGLLEFSEDQRKRHRIYSDRTGGSFDQKAPGIAGGRGGNLLER